MNEPLSHGTVVLAAYKPDPQLFARQLESIRDQTHRDFECLISADGNPDDIRALVQRSVGDDVRFRVIGFEERKGFYGNFERAIGRVDAGSEWIALSDQDDYWYPEKLASLLPWLERYSLVSGQARVVEHPSGRVINADTERLDLAAPYFVLTNQFTGSLCVFRREVVDVALPFPRMATPSEVHDHWLALCASTLSGTHVSQDIVQNYVQHGANVVGEMLAKDTIINPASSWRTLRSIADRNEGSHGPVALARSTFKVSVGWRQLMVETLATRVPSTSEMKRLLMLYGHARQFWRTMRFLRSARAQRFVAARSVLEYVAGWIAGWLVGGRTLALPDDEDSRRPSRSASSA